jgi:hypothetical protein
MRTRRRSSGKTPETLVATANSTYNGCHIEVRTSRLFSGRVSFSVYIDGTVWTNEIDGPDEDTALSTGLSQARQEIDRRADRR